ncbi:MAG: hypothetical protein AAB337_02690 [Patescibacteria group bacterium]
MDTQMHHELVAKEDELIKNNEPIKETKTISIKIPNIKLPTLQSAVLIMLIAVGILQTAQLFALDRQIADIKTSSSDDSADSDDSATSSLPEMVGGC